MLLSSQDLGAALRAKRRAAGLTQADLAQRAGCRRQTIVAIEAGHSVQSDVLLAAVVALGQGLLLVDAGAGQVLAAIAREAGGLTDEEGPSSRVRASSPQPAQRVLINPVPSLKQATHPPLT